MKKLSTRPQAAGRRRHRPTPIEGVMQRFIDHNPVEGSEPAHRRIHIFHWSAQDAQGQIQTLGLNAGATRAAYQILCKSEVAVTS
jgi:hypothetical protein